MRRGTLAACIIGWTAVCSSAISADPDAASPTPTANPTASTQETPTPPTDAVTSQPAQQPAKDDFGARQQRLKQQQALQQAMRDARKPTAWQLQNPSGRENHYLTDRELPGYVAPNNYFGPQYRDWNNQSPPVAESQRQGNMTATTPVTQTNVMLAPYGYWGASSARWSNVSTGRTEPNPLGGWTVRPGW